MKRFRKKPWVVEEFREYSLSKFFNQFLPNHEVNIKRFAMDGFALSLSLPFLEKAVPTKADRTKKDIAITVAPFFKFFPISACEAIFFNPNNPREYKVLGGLREEEILGYMDGAEEEQKRCAQAFYYAITDNAVAMQSLLPVKYLNDKIARYEAFFQIWQICVQVRKQLDKYFVSKKKVNGDIDEFYRIELAVAYTRMFKTFEFDEIIMPTKGAMSALLDLVLLSKRTEDKNYLHLQSTFAWDAGLEITQKDCEHLLKHPTMENAQAVLEQAFSRSGRV